MPERTSPASAVNDGLPIKPDALQALRFDGPSRRAFSRPSRYEMTFGRFGSSRQPSGAFGSNSFAEGNCFGWGTIHCASFHSLVARSLRALALAPAAPCGGLANSPAAARRSNSANDSRSAYFLPQMLTVLIHPRRSHLH